MSQLGISGVVPSLDSKAVREAISNNDSLLKHDGPVGALSLFLGDIKMRTKPRRPAPFACDEVPIPRIPPYYVGYGQIT